MLKTLATLLCICFALPAHAKLGESAPELIKRFGTSYRKESRSIGESYRFRSQNVSVDATLVDGISVAETYFSDHPLTAQGEPPNDIVRAILKTNAPQARWIETDAAAFRADYALRSSDNKYVATLKYSGLQPEKMIWTMTVAVASLIDQLPGNGRGPENTSPSAPKAIPGASLFPSFSPRFTNPRPSPTAAGNQTPKPLDRAIEEAKRKEHEAAIGELTKAIEKNPNDADALAERGYNYSLISEFEKAVADYQAALKIKPDDHKTELRLGSAKAMAAARALPLPTSTPSPADAALPAPAEPTTIRHQAGGLVAEVIRIVALAGAALFGFVVAKVFQRRTLQWIAAAVLSGVAAAKAFRRRTLQWVGAAVLSGVAVAKAFRRRTPRWTGAAVLAAILFGLLCMIFTRAVSDRITTKHRDAAFNRPSDEGVSSSPRVSPSPIEATPAPIPIVASRIQRSVVLIAGMSSSGELVETGTGFFISSDGHLITCWHVVAPANIDHFRITRNDGAECNVEGILGFSVNNDLAVLKTAVSAADFLPIRRTETKPAPGTRILVFGNPGQLRGVWSEGAVSGFLLTGKDASRDSLRFDAPIAPGSSGSPVVDIEKGDVVGVVSAAGWFIGNLAIPFYYLTDLIDSKRATTAISLAELRVNLEKQKPTFKQRVFDKERDGDLTEAALLCDEYSAQYPGEVWGAWEHAQISFALDDYNAASFYTAWLEPAKDPGDDLLCAIQFETGDALFWAPVQRATLMQKVELLRKDYGVEICAVQMRPDRQLNVRGKPDAKSDVLYQFDADEHVFAKQDRVRNSGGKEKVTWRKVLLLPTRDQIHGGEAWVNERYIAPLSTSVN